MATYLVINYDISDSEKYAEYNPGSIPAIMATLGPHGGELVFGGRPTGLKGSAPQASVCLRFGTADAANAWLDDPEYAPLKQIRLDSTTNINTWISEGPD